AVRQSDAGAEVLHRTVGEMRTAQHQVDVGRCGREQRLRFRRLLRKATTRDGLVARLSRGLSALREDVPESGQYPLPNGPLRGGGQLLRAGDAPALPDVRAV